MPVSYTHLIALNMMDIVRKRGDRIDTEKLSRDLGCQVLEISALKAVSYTHLDVYKRQTNRSSSRSCSFAASSP